ncbi:MAG: hypothetical protein K2L01_04490, partial [Rikenellaceae bacterium]|nr:hypothetical protein [Rikenellaceae bacterium]
FTASEWDVTGITSSNTALPVSAIDFAGGTFTVGFAETLTHDSPVQNATITLNGADGMSRGSYSTTQKKVTFTFDPASHTFPGQASLTQNVSVTTDAGTEWKVATNSNNAAITSTKSGNNLVLTTVAKASTTEDATANIVLTINDCTSQTFVAKQLRTVTATLTAPSGSVYSDNTLSAYSAAKTYDFTLALNRAVDKSKIVITRTSGSLTVPTVTTTGSLASHTVRVTVPASTLTTEPTSTFTITVDGDAVQTFTVKQAKKPSISVSTPTTVGGASTAVSGTFTASTWDIKSTGFVTSNDATLSIASSSNTGTFSVNRKASFNNTDANLTATITLVGAYTASLATCTIAQNKVIYSFSPTSLSLKAIGESAEVTVTSSNAGTISSGMDATSSNPSWCTVSVSGNKVTVTAQSNLGNNTTSRSATVYVTYKESQSQTFTVTQEGGPQTVYIGNLHWTIYNLANPRQASGGATFATKLPSNCSGIRSESHGKFYQWGINVAWDSTSDNASGATPSGTWKTSVSNPSWASSPCPVGFRLPTSAEYTTLRNCTKNRMSGTWSSSNYGYITFSNGSTSLEFPAVGYREGASSSGTLKDKGQWGHYWTSTMNGTDAYYLYFTSSQDGVRSGGQHYGFSVRCVREERVT